MSSRPLSARGGIFLIDDPDLRKRLVFLSCKRLISEVLSGFFQKFGFGGGYAQGTGTSPHGPVPPPEDEPRKFGGYAQGTGRSLHGPVPPDPEEQSRLFVPLPVEPGDVESPKSMARLRQFARLQRSEIRRRCDASVWLLRRKISRVHRVYPARNIAAFYLLLAAVLCLALGRAAFLVRASSAPIVSLDGQKKNFDSEFSHLNALISARKFAEADDLARELETVDPDDIRLLTARGVLASAQGDSEAARRYFTKANTLVPGMVPIIVNLAENEFVTGRYREAEVHYRKILVEQPANLRAILRLYFCARLQQEPQDAARYLELTAPYPNSLEWFYIRAADALFEGRTEKGGELLEKARALFGDATAPYDKTLVRLGLIPPR